MNKTNTSSLMAKIDTFFDVRQLTPGKYFMIGFLLSGLWALSVHLWKYRPAWFTFFLGALFFGWLVWIGPRYLQRYKRKRVLLFGTLTFFLPQFINAFMLWLGQPGWPLDEFMGRPFMDTGALASLFIFAGIVYGLLLLRMKMYDAVSVKRHSKKDLFQ